MSFLKKLFVWDLADVKDPAEKSEIQANRAIAIVLFIVALSAMVGTLLNALDVFKNDKLKTQILCAVTMFFAFSGTIYCFIKRGRGKFVKIALLFDVMVLAMAISFILSYFTALFIVVPILCATRYYKMRDLIVIGGVSLAVIIASPFLWPFLESQANLNLFGREIPAISAWINDGTLDYWSYVWRGMLYMQLPTALIFSAIAVFSLNSVIRGRAIVKETTERYLAEAKLSSELSVAKGIQADMLPTNFPNNETFGLCGSMTPARDVGGDLYDFFFIDKTHLALVIADVSGKGIPAALFMARAKTLIMDHISEGKSLEEAAAKVNDRLCEGNSAGLFVTAWLGVIDLTTGVLTYVNAGHNPPVVRHNGHIEFLREKSGMAFGGMEGLPYRVHEIPLKPKDALLLYTDGVTEANNPQDELYGEARLLACLRAAKQGDPKGLVERISSDLAEFSKGREQFDDITTLVFSFYDFLKEAPK